MAEYVQQTLEEMTNEVLQLERVGLFDHSEIKKIVSKRKRYEYKLRRRVKNKEDFLNYIEYEENVLSLISIRRKQDGYQHKKGEIEGAILKRILSLFHIVCRNWPQSQELWLARIKFVQTKMKNKSLVSSFFTKLLQVITNDPNLWVMAAKYEFDSVYSIESARHVLQKGISFNKESTLLWHEYFRLELLFVDSVRRREKLKEAHLLGKVSIPRYVEGSLRQEVKAGKVACTVYTHARKSLPDDFSFAVNFIPIVTQFQWTEDVEDFIFTELFEAFSHHPELWEVKANRFIDALHTTSPDFMSELAVVERKCNKLLKLLIKKQSTDSSWSVYLSVHYKLLTLNPSVESLSAFLLLLSLVDHKRCLTEQWVLKWAQIVAERGDGEQTVEVLEKAVEMFPESERVWTCYIEYLSTTDIALAISVFHRARKSLKQESLALWQLIVKLCTGAVEGDTLKDFYELAIAAHRSVAGVMKEQYLHWVFVNQGIKEARKLFKRLRQTIAVTVGFYRTYIDMESCQCPPDVDKMRTAYRHMLHEFGETSVDAWLEIIALEREAGDVGKTSVLYSQAVKCLEGGLVDKFIRENMLR